jgi:hypothetical protein
VAKRIVLEHRKKPCHPIDLLSAMSELDQRTIRGGERPLGLRRLASKLQQPPMAGGQQQGDEVMTKSGNLWAEWTTTAS